MNKIYNTKVTSLKYAEQLQLPNNKNENASTFVSKYITTHYPTYEIKIWTDKLDSITAVLYEESTNNYIIIQIPK